MKINPQILGFLLTVIVPATVIGQNTNLATDIKTLPISSLKSGIKFKM